MGWWASGNAAQPTNPLLHPVTTSLTQKQGFSTIRGINMTTPDTKHKTISVVIRDLGAAERDYLTGVFRFVNTQANWSIKLYNDRAGLEGVLSDRAASDGILAVLPHRSDAKGRPVVRRRADRPRRHSAGQGLARKRHFVRAAGRPPDRPRRRRALPRARQLQRLPLRRRPARIRVSQPPGGGLSVAAGGHGKARRDAAHLRVRPRRARDRGDPADAHEPGERPRYGREVRRHSPTAARTFSIVGAAAARAFAAPARRMSSSVSVSFASSSRFARNGSKSRWYASRSAFFA